MHTRASNVAKLIVTLIGCGGCGDVLGFKPFAGEAGSGGQADASGTDWVWSEGGGTLCLSDNALPIMTSVTSDVYWVGRGLGGTGDDWCSTSFPMKPSARQASGKCVTLPVGRLYRGTTRVEPAQGPQCPRDAIYWGRLDALCASRSHPFCFNRSDGMSLCFLVTAQGGLEDASDESCNQG